MKVGIDVSAFAQTRAGTARYLRNLLRRVSQEVDVRVVAFGGPSRRDVLLRELVWYPLVLPRTAEHQRFDVLHCPTYYGPVRSRVPVVVTVHDLAVLRRPEAFNAWTRTYVPRVVPHVIRNAARVIAVSEFTKRELVDVLAIDERRIRVIPNGVEDVFTPDGPRADGDYVLAVGTLEPRKNLDHLRDAARLAGVELRVVGERGWGGVSANGWVGRVDDEQLARLYRGAACFAYPSLYEGFGIPIVEAMACGAAVVTSRGGATEEAAGGAAVLVDPHDVDSIAHGLREAIARRDELRARGLEQARRFSWDDAARATLDVYREVGG